MSSVADVRPATAADAGAIARIYAPYVTDSAASFEEVPPDADEMARRMQGSPRLPWLLARRTGMPVGYCYASLHRTRAAYRWSVEVSVYLAAAEQGRGTGRALYAELFDQLSDLGYVTAFAGITVPNDASEGFHQAMGFERIGTFRSVGFKHDAWRDVGWWQRPLREAPARPPEPLAWDPARR